MRQAYDYWQDQPGRYIGHTEARTVKLGPGEGGDSGAVKQPPSPPTHHRLFLFLVVRPSGRPERGTCTTPRQPNGIKERGRRVRINSASTAVPKCFHTWPEAEPLESALSTVPLRGPTLQDRQGEVRSLHSSDSFLGTHFTSGLGKHGLHRGWRRNRAVTLLLWKKVKTETKHHDTSVRQQTVQVT